MSECPWKTLMPVHLSAEPRQGLGGLLSSTPSDHEQSQCISIQEMKTACCPCIKPWDALGCVFVYFIARTILFVSLFPGPDGV